MMRIVSRSACLIVLFVGCSAPADSPQTRDEAAKWIFSKGGRIEVSTKAGEIKSPNELPAGAFAIEKVNLNQAKLKDAELFPLHGLKHLKSLFLYGTDVGDEGVEHFTGLTSLQNLELSYTRVTDEGVKKLVALKNLRKLFLRGTSERVSAGGVKAIREGLPACEVFR